MNIQKYQGENENEIGSEVKLKSEQKVLPLPLSCHIHFHFHLEFPAIFPFRFSSWFSIFPFSSIFHLSIPFHLRIAPHNFAIPLSIWSRFDSHLQFYQGKCFLRRVFCLYPYMTWKKNNKKSWYVPVGCTSFCPVLWFRLVDLLIDLIHPSGQLGN